MTPELTDEQRQAFLTELEALSVQHGIAIRGPFEFNMIRIERVNGSGLKYVQTDSICGDPVYCLRGDIPFPLSESEIAAREAAEARVAAERAAKIAAGYTWDERSRAWRDKDGSL